MQRACSRASTAPGEGLAVEMLVRMAQPVHIRLQDRRDDVLLAEALIR